MCDTRHPPGVGIVLRRGLLSSAPGAAVTVNGRPAPPDPLIRAGGSVRVVYRLTNTGDQDIDGVLLPAGAGGTIVCPSGGGDIPKLEEHQQRRLRGILSAAAGSHDGTVTATGHAGYDWLLKHATVITSDWDQPVTASAPVGYHGVSGLIAATDTVSVTPTASGGRATVAYTVTDTGNMPVYDVALSDPLGPAGRITCAGTLAPPRILQPGAAAHCTAVVDLTPGPHGSTLSVTASDRTSTAGSERRHRPAADPFGVRGSRFTVVALPPPPPRRPRRARRHRLRLRFPRRRRTPPPPGRAPPRRLHRLPPRPPPDSDSDVHPAPRHPAPRRPRPRPTRWSQPRPTGRSSRAPESRPLCSSSS